MGVFDKINSPSSAESGGVFSRMKRTDDYYNARGASEMDESRQINAGREASQQIERDFLKQQETMNAEDNPSHFQTDRNAMLGVKARNLPVLGSALKAIDSFATNPIVDKAADIARSFYIPGGGAANIAGLTGAAESAVARVLPRLANSAAGRVTQRALSEGIVGAPLGAAQEQMMNPDASATEIGKGAAIGGAFGSLLGGGAKAAGAGLGSIAEKYAGTKIGDAIGRLIGREVHPHEQVTQEILALPPGRGEVRYNAAMERSRQPYGSDRMYPAVDIPANALPSSPAYEAAQKLRREIPLSLPESHRYSDIQKKLSGKLPYGSDPILSNGKIADPLALPQGNYVKPQRLKVATGNESLDYVLKQIKQDVEDAISIPSRRDKLIDYIQDNLQIPRSEIHNMPNADLQELGQMVRQNISVYDKAVQIASNRGYDLPKLLEGKAPKVSESIARNAQERVAGIYPESLPNLQEPRGFNRSNTANAAGSRERYDVNRSNSEVPVKHVETQNSPEYMMQRAQQQLDMISKLERARELEKPIIGIAAEPVERLGARPRTSNSKVTITPPQRRFPPSEPAVMQRPAKVDGNTNRSVDQPLKTRGFAQTLIDSEKTPVAFTDKLKSAYKPITNEETLAQANKRLNKDIEESTSYVLGESRFTAEKAATAQRLIDHYNSIGNYERSVDIADKVAKEATRAGQAIQALSMFDRLSPDGVLIYARRLANKVDERKTIFSKKTEVSDEMAANLTGLATVAQKMTGIKDLSNDVMNILERAKAGEKLTETESAALRRFVSESKQFIQEVSKKPIGAPRQPRPPRDARVRDNVVSFLDAQEQAAKERLRARGNRLSSTPLDVWADYAIIGAAKMAKGVVKFADWSEQMVKDLGEGIRPNLENLYERATQALTESTKKVSAETISQAERLTEKVISGHKLEGAEADQLRTLAQKVSSLSGDAKRMASQDLQQILQMLDNPSALKRVSSIQTMGQLLNPKTQVRNALGNELFYRVERLNKLLSTPIDIARSVITGGPRTVTFRTNNQGQYWKWFLEGGKAGWKGTNINGLETQFDLSSPAFRSKYNPLRYMEKSLGAALKSFDTAAYMRAYNNTLGEMATLRAINEGQRGNKELIQKYIREADENVMKIADEYGRYVTFQDNNAISKGLVALKKGLNLKQEFGLGDLVLKYPKTPGALLMRALEYSPAGFLRSAAILARPLMKKEPNTAEVTQALSRAIIGTLGLTGMGYYLMDKGVLTGAASKDKDVRDLQRSAGQGQYQVNLSALYRLVSSGFDPKAATLREGDQLYTYDWMQPVSMAISIGANTAQNMKEGKQKLSGALGTVYNSLEGGLGTLTEQSVLSGIKNAAQGYPGQTVTDKIVDILADIPSSFVPTAFNQARQLTDNAKRETYSPSKIEQSLNVAQAKIPGLAGKLPQQYDTLGRPKQTLQNNSIFNVLFNPGNESKYVLSPEAKWIVDLINETNDETLAPRVPGKKITIQDPANPKKTIQMTLNGDQFSRLQQLQGERTRENLVKMYRPEASQKSRIARVQDVLTKSSDKAKSELKKELGVR